MVKKQIMATLAAAVVSFLGGWVIFGMLMKDFYMGHSTDAAKAIMIDPPNIPMIALANLFGGYLTAWVCHRTGSTTVGKAIVTSIRLSVVMGLSIDMFYASMMNMFTDNWTVIGVDVVGNIVMGILTGAVVGMVLNMGNKAA